MVLEEDETVDGEIEAAGVEEAKQDTEEAEEEEENEFKYDRALYDADGLEDEDVDFDWEKHPLYTEDIKVGVGCLW